MSVSILPKEEALTRAGPARNAIDAAVAEMTAFKVGDRIQLSEIGRSRIKRPPAQAGTIVSVQKRKSGRDSVMILLDGNKTPRRLHRSYIEPEQSEPAAPAL